MKAWAYGGEVRTLDNARDQSKEGYVLAIFTASRTTTVGCLVRKDSGQNLFQGLGFRVWGLVLGVWCLGCRV